MGPTDIAALRRHSPNGVRNLLDDIKNGTYKDQLKFLTTAFVTRQVVLTASASLVLPAQKEVRAYILMLSTLTVTNPRAFIGKSNVSTITGFQLPIIVPFPILIDVDTEIWGVSNSTGATITILEL